MWHDKLLHLDPMEEWNVLEFRGHQCTKGSDDSSLHYKNPKGRYVGAIIYIVHRNLHKWKWALAAFWECDYALAKGGRHDERGLLMIANYQIGSSSKRELFKCRWWWYSGRLAALNPGRASGTDLLCDLGQVIAVVIVLSKPTPPSLSSSSCNYTLAVHNQYSPIINYLT